MMMMMICHLRAHTFSDASSFCIKSEWCLSCRRKYCKTGPRIDSTAILSPKLMIEDDDKGREKVVEVVVEKLNDGGDGAITFEKTT